MEHFDCSCKRYAVQLLPATGTHDIQSFLLAYCGYCGCMSTSCPSQLRQLKAEGVPMIVKLRTGAQRFFGFRCAMPIMRSECICCVSTKNIHWIYAGGENLRMPPVLSLCFKEATRKQAWGDSTVICWKHSALTKSLNHLSFASSGVGLLCRFAALPVAQAAWRPSLQATNLGSLGECSATMQFRVK